MILLRKGEVAYITIHFDDPEIQNNSVYLFEFTNDITQELVSIDLGNVSNYIERYCAFGFIVNEYFSNKEEGFWSYNAYESNSDPIIKRFLGSGKMKLIGEAFNYTEYDGQSDEFIVYNN